MSKFANDILNQVPPSNEYRLVAPYATYRIPSHSGITDLRPRSKIETVINYLSNTYGMLSSC